MVLFDWLLGTSEFGWLKTALLAGSLGIGLLTIVQPNWMNEDPSGSHYFYILLGIIPLGIVRAVYWSARKAKLQQRLLAGDITAVAEVESLARWNGTVWLELDELVRQRF